MRAILLATSIYSHAGQPPFHFSPEGRAPMQVRLGEVIIAEFWPPELIVACDLANRIAASVANYGLPR